MNQKLQLIKDIKAAELDGMFDYAEELRAELEDLKSAEAEKVIKFDEDFLVAEDDSIDFDSLGLDLPEVEVDY